MKLKVLFLFILVVGLSACDKGEAPSPSPSPTPTPSPVVNPEITLLTFKQDISSLTSFSDDWIFVSNESGDVLDIKHFEADEAIELKSNKVTALEKINVTIFHYRQPDTETIDFTSYLAITSGQTWVYKKLNSFFPTPTGTATFTVSNTTTANSISTVISTNLGSTSTRISSPTSVPFSLYKAQERVIAYKTIDGLPSYFEANNIGNDATVIADYNTDFKPLQNLFTIDFSGSESFSAYVDGIMNEPGIDPFYIEGFLNFQRSVFTYPGGSLDSYPWGYNNGFDLYRTSMGKSKGNISRQYFKLGSAVTSIPFPDNSVTISNGSFSDFVFAFSGDYHVRNSRWIVSVPDYNSILSWRVYAPADGKQKFTKIPDEIKNLYPSLSIATLAPQVTYFSIYKDGFTYSDFINGQMNISTAKKPYSSEYQTVVIQN